MGSITTKVCHWNSLYKGNRKPSSRLFIEAKAVKRFRWDGYQGNISIRIIIAGGQDSVLGKHCQLLSEWVCESKLYLSVEEEASPWSKIILLG